jgi:amino acid transporter
MALVSPKPTEAVQAPALVPEARRPLRLIDIVLFSVSAIVVADTVALASGIGYQALTFWVISAVLFFIPYGLITAELGSTWPEEGGIYVWVREAFGLHWGAMTSWLYWINIAMWAPSVFALFTATMISVWFPGMPLWVDATIVIGLVWTMVGIGIMDLRWGKWAPNITAGIKIAVLVLLGGLGVAFAISEGLANPFKAGDLVPKFSGNLWALAAIIYSFMGFELMSSASSEIRNPKRNVPRAIAWSAGMSLIVYLVATFGLLATVKLSDLSIATGVVDGLRAAFEQVLGGAGLLFDITVILVLITFLGNMVTWSMGGNRTIRATGLDRAFPAVFAHQHPRFHTPDYAYVFMGVVATGLTLLTYGFFGTREDVFGTIFVVSSIVFLLPYLVMFPAAVYLRHRHPEVKRPFVVPLGKVGLWVSALLGELFIVLSLYWFYAYPLVETSTGVYYGITIGGTVLAVLVGVYLYFRGGVRREQSRDLTAAK